MAVEKRNLFLTIFHWLNKFRFDIGLTYFLLVLLYLEVFAGVQSGYSYWFAFALSLRIMTVYLFNKLTDRVEDKISQPAEMVSNQEIRPLVGFLIAINVLAVAILWMIGGPVGTYLLLLPVAFLYSLPLSKRRFRIKALTGIKNIYSATVDWVGPMVLMIVALPIPLQLQSSLFRSAVFAILIMMTYELTWDIRDIEGDRVAGVRTIPVVFGVSVAKILGFIYLSSAAIFFGQTLSQQGLINLVYVALGLTMLTPKSPGWQFHLFLYGQVVLLSVALLSR